MPNTKTYFTEQFLTYLTTTYATSASKLYLLQDDSSLVFSPDFVELGDDISLVKKVEAEIETEIIKNTFEWKAKIKNADKKWKTKVPVFAGTLTEVYWGTSTGSLSDLSHWGLESANSLIESEGPVNIYLNITNTSLFGETLLPDFGSGVKYGYSTEPYLYYSSDQPLFVKENPTERLAETIFGDIFNSSTDYKLHIFRGTPELETDTYGTTTYSYWSSASDFFSMTIPDLFPLYIGSYMDGTNTVPLSTSSGLLFYPGVQTSFEYGENEQITISGSASTLTSFMYQSESGLMLGTFVDFLATVTSTEPINGFFLTNERIKTKNNSEEEIPLILFGCEIDGGVNFTHKAGNGNYSIMKTPKFSLSMDVIVI